MPSTARQRKRSPRSTALREAAKEDSELRKTVNDCEALAWLGRYYASKIRGACALALFDVNGDTFEHEAALRHLGDALAHWKRYAAIRDAHYVPALYNRVGHVNVTALTERWPPISSSPATGSRAPSRTTANAPARRKASANEEHLRLAGIFPRAQCRPLERELESHRQGGDTTGDLVVRYTREVVTQVLDEYPDLTGLGITLGERMGGMTPDQRRDWLDQTFFAGIAEAKRPAKFIYRAPLSADTGSGGTTSEENDRRSRAQIESLTNNITGPVYVEFKHNWSHAHSSPDLFIVHGGTLSDAYWNPPPTRHKVVWTMRNEDMFILRWGQPDFVREFVQRQGGKDYVGGAIIGSECYIPALDYITKEGPHKTWRWAFQRQWLFYAVWGQLLYDPATPDARFEAMFDARFGQGTGKDLLAAWKLASRVPLHFASFHRGTWDGSLYTEGFSSWTDRDDGARTFFGIDAFIKHPVLDTKRYINIADYVKTGRVPQGVMSPIELAAKLDRDSAPR
jgi:hypothetical protein